MTTSAPDTSRTSRIVRVPGGRLRRPRGFFTLFEMAVIAAVVAVLGLLAWVAVGPAFTSPGTPAPVTTTLPSVAPTEYAPTRMDLLRDGPAQTQALMAQQKARTGSYAGIHSVLADGYPGLVTYADVSSYCVQLTVYKGVVLVSQDGLVGHC